MEYQVQYKGRPISGTLTVPGSKSIANRALFIRELCQSNIIVSGLPDNEDTRLMEDLLRLINRTKNSDENHPLVLDCHNTGTVFRFLTSLLSITPGYWILTGSERMKERPVGILVNALRSLGASIHYSGKPGFPPLYIEGKELHGGMVEMNTDESSQYISSLLMISPLLSEELTLVLTGKRVSEPYISMTVALMEKFDITLHKLANGFRIEPQPYHFKPITVERDWSSASCWYQTVALSENGELCIKGLEKNSLQGDRILATIYSRLGVNTRFTEEGIVLSKGKISPEILQVDLKDHPDIVPSLAVAMAGNQIQGSIGGIEHLRIKESDRISSIYQELQKAGYSLEIIENKLIFNGIKNPSLPGLLFNSHNDHRIAMALAPLALKINSLTISGGEAVGKSYQKFWSDLYSIGFEVLNK